MFETKEQIEQWLKRYRINNYVINEDLTVDVYGKVILSNHNLKELPIQFRRVRGNFELRNNKLKSLKGCPIIVDGDFSCENNRLTSLEYCPQKVGDLFNCSKNRLRDLRYSPQSIPGAFYCNNNKIVTLKNGPRNVGSIFNCAYNRLKSLRYMPKLEKKANTVVFCNSNAIITLRDIVEKGCNHIKYDGNILPFDNNLSVKEIVEIYQTEEIIKETACINVPKKAKLKI